MFSPDKNNVLERNVCAFELTNLLVAVINDTSNFKDSTHTLDDFASNYLLDSFILQHAFIIFKNNFDDRKISSQLKIKIIKRNRKSNPPFKGFGSLPPISYEIKDIKMENINMSTLQILASNRENLVEFLLNYLLGDDLIPDLYKINEQLVPLILAKVALKSTTTL